MHVLPCTLLKPGKKAEEHMLGKISQLVLFLSIIYSITTLSYDFNILTLYTLVMQKRDDENWMKHTLG